MRLTCSCCGDGFSGEYDGSQDKGFGTCPRCVDWIWETFTKPQLEDAARKLRAALNPRNQARFDAMTPEQRLWVAGEAIDDGLFEFKIGRKA